MPKRRRPPSLNRPPPSLSDRPRVLVVCEGKRTEPLYFQALKDYLRLPTLVVKGTGGVDPRTLVDRATELRDDEKRRGDAFDFVYCVFDRDTHPTFEEASNVARDRRLELARSWPCFEFWLLLHFEFSRKAYARRERQSPCDVCIQDLRRHIPNYSKGDGTHQDDLWDRSEAAIARARHALTNAESTGEPNPSTEVHRLVEHLRTLARPPGT